MTEWNQQEIDKAYGEIYQRSKRDADFRKLVLEKPKEAIKQITGKEVPEKFKLKIVESDPNYALTLLLPEFMGDELSDDELEQVAGGTCGWYTCSPVLQCASRAR